MRLQPELTILSATAIVLYAITVALAIIAARTSRRCEQQLWHFRVWFGVALFFCCLMIMRYLGFEENLRAHLRAWLFAESLLAARRSIQAPLAVVLVAFFPIAFIAAAHYFAKRVSGRRNIAVLAAVASCSVMVATIAARTISFHALDWFLNGPLKLNWAGDIGATLGVISAASIYVLLVNGRLPHSRK